MCLSLYLGAHAAMPPSPHRGLGWAATEAKPPPLADFPHVHVLGELGQDGQPGCACGLINGVTWTEAGATLGKDEPNPEQTALFDGLREAVLAAMESGLPVALSCDDMADWATACAEDRNMDHFEQLLLSPSLIRPDAFLFTHPTAIFPWRVFHLVAEAR